MHRALRRGRAIASIGVLAACLVAPASASAQAAPLLDSYTIGAWTFRPSLELRFRGEYRRNPVDSGGALYSSTAILADGYRLNLPDTLNTTPPVQSEWLVGERARLGLSVDRGPVTGVLLLQDARVFGSQKSNLAGPAEPTVPSFAPFEAYIDVHSRSGRRMFLRVGRQRVTWGSGRLLGENDWTPTARSLDAGRFGIEFGDINIELMAALLSSPGELPAGSSSGEGSGAQLYGADGVWHLMPLFNVEVTGLARVVRDPSPRWLKPSDTFLVGGRFFGDRGGLRYDLEGAYELGRVQSFGVNRSLSAFALAGRVAFETSLPGHLTFAAQGAYASGDNGDTDPNSTQKRFDPILPDAHDNLGPMGLYAWSNLIEGGGDLSLQPTEEVTLRAGYRYVALAQPGGRWSNAILVPVGSAPENGSRALGHEIDASVGWTPWDGVRVSGGYGLFLFASGAEAILRDANRYSSGMQHWGFVQTTLRAP
jgi:hypothetical protein